MLDSKLLKKLDDPVWGLCELVRKLEQNGAVLSKEQLRGITQELLVEFGFERVKAALLKNRLTNFFVNWDAERGGATVSSFSELAIPRDNSQMPIPFPGQGKCFLTCSSVVNQANCFHPATANPNISNSATSVDFAPLRVTSVGSESAEVRLNLADSRLYSSMP